MKIGITGATGFVGSHLAESLSAKGFEVTCLIRKTSNLRWLKHLKLKTFVGDYGDPRSLKPFLENQDIIIHAAGVTKARTPSEYLAGNSESTRNLLEAVLSYNSDLTRFVLISSQAAAGPSNGRIFLVESDPRHPITSYGKSKALAEQYVNDVSDQIPVTIIRPPAVYGPRDTDIYVYFKLIYKNLQLLTGYENEVSIVYVKNLVAAIEQAMTHKNAVGETYFVTDDGAYTWGQLADKIAQSLEKRPIRIVIPGWIISLIAGINSAYSTLCKKTVLLNKEKLLELRQPYWLVSNQKIRQQLGFSPPYTTEEGIRETAAWYLNMGWL